MDRDLLEQLLSKYRPQVEAAKAAAAGGMQGVSMGYSDELTGGAKAAYDTVAGPAPLDQFWDNYRKHRDLDRQQNAAYQENNPTAYTAGNIGGGLASFAIPGMGGASLAKGLMQAGAAGAGHSMADATRGDVSGLGKDVAYGGIENLLWRGAGKAAPAVMNAARRRNPIPVEKAAIDTRAAEELFRKEQRRRSNMSDKDLEQDLLKRKTDRAASEKQAADTSAYHKNTMERIENEAALRDRLKVKGKELTVDEQVANFEIDNMSTKELQDLAEKQNIKVDWPQFLNSGNKR